VPAENHLMTRTRERYAAIQNLHKEGKSLAAIGRILTLDRKTVQRFARATNIDELLSVARTRRCLLGPFKPYLHEQFNAGHTDATGLTREITAQGYRGSEQTVRRYLQPFRPTMTAPPPLPTPPSVRTVTGWMTRHPDDLTDDDKRNLQAITDRSPTLHATSAHVRDFAKILVNRHGHLLQDWMREIDNTGAPALQSFVAGLRRDLAAVTAGLTLPHNSGPVEGTVNKIKMLKRQMYGKAKFDLLRKRVPLTT
jgi:transposase